MHRPGETRYGGYLVETDMLRGDEMRFLTDETDIGGEGILGARCPSGEDALDGGDVPLCDVGAEDAEGGTDAVVDVLEDFEIGVELT